MSDHASPEHGPEHGEPKHRSIVDLAELYQPIVPLPGRAGEGGADFVLGDPTAATEWPAADGVADGVQTPRLKARASSEHLDPPSARDDTPPAPTAAAPNRPSRPRVRWWWAALLALGAAAGAGVAGALWVNHARQPAVQASQRTAAPAPPSASEVPATPPADDTVASQLTTAPHAASEPPLAAPPSSPGPAITEAAPAPPAATQPAAVAAATLPTPATPPAPAVSGPAPENLAPAQAARRIVVYYRRTSPAAAADAARLSAQLRPHAARVDQRAATAIPRLPTIRYFHPEDADAAEALAAALGRPAAAGWRVQDVSPRANQPPPGTFEVWLAKP